MLAFQLILIEKYINVYHYNSAGDEKLVNVLIKNEVDINDRDDSGNTPLHLAATKGMHKYTSHH